MRELNGENMRNLVEKTERLTRLNVQHVADIRVVLYEKAKLGINAYGDLSSACLEARNTQRQACDKEHPLKWHSTH